MYSLSVWVDVTVPRSCILPTASTGACVYPVFMKVIFLIPHVSDGGAEKIASDLSFTLGVDEILLVVFQQRQGYAFQGRLISMDLPIERHSVFGRVGGFIRRTYRFRRIRRQERPDC